MADSSLVDRVFILNAVMLWKKKLSCRFNVSLMVVCGNDKSFEAQDNDRKADSSAACQAKVTRVVGPVT